MMPPTRAQDAAQARTFDVAVDAIRRWRADPVAFVEEVIGANPDPWQRDFLRGFPENNRHALQACKGPGKTTSLSWVGWNFMVTRPHCKVPCASITGDNLKDGLWAEFAKWRRGRPLLERAFEWTATRIFQRENPETWFASARKIPQNAEPQQQANTIAGVHEDYLLWLLDEVSEQPDGVLSAAEAALTSGIETRIAIAGNCTRNDGPLYRAAVSERHLWRVTRITGDPDDPNRSPRIDIEECRKQIAKYGRSSYIVKVNILGEFPDRQADKLLDRTDVDKAQRRSYSDAEIGSAPRIIGADVARMGDDASKFAPRQGPVAFEFKEFRQQRSDQLGDHLIASLNRWDADMAFIDGSGGYGGGVHDHCLRMGFGSKVRLIGFGDSATEDSRFENKRAEMYWLCAEWVKETGSLPDDPLLAEELCAPIYWFDRKGRVCIEAKEDIKKRIGRSPDGADALVLTFAGPVKPRASSPRIQRPKRREYHPFDKRS